MAGDFDESEPARGELKETQVHAMWDALDASNPAAVQARQVAWMVGYNVGWQEAYDKGFLDGLHRGRDLADIPFPEAPRE